MTRFVKITFENEKGKNKLYLTEEQLFHLLEHDTFTSTSIDAKNGRAWVHKDEILKDLKIEKPKE